MQILLKIVNIDGFLSKQNLAMIYRCCLQIRIKFTFVNLPDFSPTTVTHQPLISVIIFYVYNYANVNYFVCLYMCAYE